MGAGGHAKSSTRQAPRQGLGAGNRKGLGNHFNETGVNELVGVEIIATPIDEKNLRVDGPQLKKCEGGWTPKKSDHSTPISRRGGVNELVGAKQEGSGHTQILRGKLRLSGDTKEGKWEERSSPC